MENAAEQPVEPVETEEAAQTEDSAPQTDSEESQEQTPAEPEDKKPKGVQKRLDELTRNWREEQRRSRWLEEQLEKAQQQRVEPQQPTSNTERPKLEDFETTEDWAEALADWKVEQKFVQKEQESKEVQARQTFQEKEQIFHRKAAEFSLQHEDFDDAIRSIPLSESTYKSALNSEKAPELLYHLSQDFELASRIDSMDPVSAAMELGRIEASLVRNARTTSNAPDPVEPVSGVGGSVDPDPDSMTTEEWLDWRNKQIRG